MLRRMILSATFCILACPLWADSFRDTIVTNLKAQGYTEIEIRRTFLGRERIKAESPTHSREIVYNPVTGVILRDRWIADDDHDHREDGNHGIVDPNAQEHKGENEREHENEREDEREQEDEHEQENDSSDDHSDGDRDDDRDEADDESD